MKNWGFVQENKNYLIIGEISEDKLEKFEIYDTSQQFLIGNIYRGRIVDKIPGLNAFFVDIGHEKKGFLQVDKKKFNKYFQGNEILVQIKSQELGNKGSKLTDNLELNFEDFILLLEEKTIHFSKKINNELKKESLKTLFNSFFSNSDIGIIFRTRSQVTDLAIIKEKLKKAKLFVEKLQKEKNFSPTPKLIYKIDFTNEILDFSQELKIITNSKNIFENIKDDRNNSNKSYNKDLLIYDENFKISNKEIFLEISKLFSRKVILDNGIELVIDKTEALSVIDINTKGFLREKTSKSLFDANINSVEEMVKQIHFRNLSGIILVDFISNMTPKEEDEIIYLINKYSNKFSSPLNIVGFTKLGILEMTRKKNSKHMKLDDISLKSIS